MYRYAIRIGTRLELVTQLQFKVALMPEVRVIKLADLIRAIFDQHLFVEVQQLRVFTAGLFPPAVEMLR